MNKKAKHLLERGISNLYEKYSNRDRYNEDVALIVGMDFGTHGIQPCHNNCMGVCESGSSICGGLLGYEQIMVEGCRLYIIYCNNGAVCGCHEL